ncbi:MULTISPECIES: hypothetical protein [Enterobacter]|uniref:hypothetical protein n=1 Tax=Enterobacter TaxID=547 RepID=UPI00044919FE|nr:MULTISPECIES: hypothetical protein [Enterobacter]MDU4483222.1 hypothetical protein [Enterobacter sp.]BBW46962.1 hypothetical protein STN0717ENT73_32760 [Enterobacter cloacae]EKS6752715.1 hypothetical protein [Enterobacter asburiae]EUL36864.1 hypothetical protein P852_03031 [Enterobacter asburiae]KSX14117.1 hypothetical protein APT79_00605 [Enterobacter sp. K66-74]
MDSAKEIAKDMLEAIHIDGSGFIGAVAKGVISLPISLAYLGYDFIDTEHRRENQDDKFRLAALVKKVTFNDEVIYKVIKPFIDDFVSHVDMHKISNFSRNISGSVIGKMMFSQFTGVNLGRAIISQGVGAFFSGSVAGGVLGVGAEASRSIYTSRYLRERNSIMYEKLNSMGDFDLFYYIVEDIVRPYETACEIAKINSEEFNNVCEYFFGGL